MLKAKDIDKILSLNDSDHIGKIGMNENKLYITFHFRKKVIFLPNVRPFIKEAYDTTFCYEVGDIDYTFKEVID